MPTRLRNWRTLGAFGVVAFWVSTVSYAATALDLAGPTEPSRRGDLTEYVAAYLAYRRELEPWEQLQNWTLVAALIALGALVQVRRHGLVGAPFQLAGAAIAAGTLVTAVTQVAYLGALDRVLAASAVSDFDPLSLGTLVDTIGRTDDYVESFGILLVAGGVAVWARLPVTAGRGGWKTTSLALAVGLVVVGVTGLAGSDLVDAALLVTGLVLAPFWTALLALSLDEVTDRAAA